MIDAVGMEAHGSPVGAAAHRFVGLLPDAVAAKLMQTAGLDKLNALYTAIDIVRRGGTISLSGVYGGMADPMPMLQLFDKQVQLRMGQANVHRWAPDILPLLTDADPLGVDDFATHRLPLSAAPQAYETFQKKQDGMVKTLLQPKWVDRKEGRESRRCGPTRGRRRRAGCQSRCPTGRIVTMWRRTSPPRDRPTSPRAT